MDIKKCANCPIYAVRLKISFYSQIMHPTTVVEDGDGNHERILGARRQQMRSGFGVQISTLESSSDVARMLRMIRDVSLPSARAAHEEPWSRPRSSHDTCCDEVCGGSALLLVPVRWPQ